MGSKNANKPWLDDRGQSLPAEEIKVICQNWGPQDWEDYLLSCELGREEKLLSDPATVEDFSEEECASLFVSMSNLSQFPVLTIALSSCLRDLPRRQRQFITRHYWEDKSLSEIAKEYEVSRQAVNKSIKTGIKSLKKQLSSGKINHKIKLVKKIISG